MNRRRSAALPASLAVALALCACTPISLSDEAAANGPPTSPSVDLTDASSGASPAFGEAGTRPADSTSAEAYRSACGDIAACNPDDPLACAGESNADAGPSGAHADAGIAIHTDAGTVAQVDAHADGATGQSDAGPRADDAGTPLPPARACRPFAIGEQSACGQAGLARQGEACASSEECGAGLVCAGDRCEATCCSRATPCGTGRGCILQPTGEAPAAWIPICAPVRPCEFDADVDAGSCLRGTQCGFGEDEAARSCVPVGPAREGESCSRVPCGQALACLGRGEMRRCARLCTPGSTDCPGALRCRTHPALLGSTAIGFCAP